MPIRILLRRAPDSPGSWRMSIEMAVSVSHNQFTAHNIRLPDGTETWPEGTLLEEYGSFRAPVRMLKLVFPEGLRDKSIADLGCLEGGFTTGFWRQR
jgi:hypothetical protein